MALNKKLRLNPGALTIALLLTTAAIAYTRTGTVQQSLQSLPINTSLVIALFSFLGGVLESIRTKSPAAFIVGHIFSAVYVLSFARLREGQPSGAEIGLLGSCALATIPLANTGLNLISKELGYVGGYGVAVFANAYGGVGLALTLLFSLVLLAYRDEIRQIQARVDERI
ncbi:hypothetical protein BDV36DRAFT_294605 [Aspergillus pseudocaelatus]|uniref:HPP family-domain-containing protein n=1 Tax=Aspergillus pseudocaelatus TaxID=1825620 RepID=A0ABQ6WPD9_9EURO|nr:hypothetical protein BDV36DRAFT_294605 [Aspergillus pseudocaelatus]